MELAGIINRIYAESSWHIIAVYTANHSYALRYSKGLAGLGALLVTSGTKPGYATLARLRDRKFGCDTWILVLA